jgi:hypothetical protein
MIERHCAAQLDIARAQASEMQLMSDDGGMQWLFSFLSADKKKTSCLYEATTRH